MNSFTVVVEPYGTYSVNAEFYASGTNAPYIEVEYLINGKAKRIVHQFTLAGGAVGQYDVVTGDTSISFEDVPASDSLLGIGISHVYKKSGEQFNLGNNFRLSLHETLSKTGAAAMDADFVYTDSMGMKHGFRDTYYYINFSGVKTSISKSFVTVELDGRLTYTTGGRTYEVKKEQRTLSGLTAITVKEGFINNRYIDERHEKVIQAEQKLKQLQIQELSNRMQEANDLLEKYKESKCYDRLQKNYEDIAKKAEEFSKAETEYLFKHYPEGEEDERDLSSALSFTNQTYIRSQSITSADKFHEARGYVFEGLCNGYYVDDDANENPEIRTAFNYHYTNMLNEYKHEMQSILDEAEDQEYCGVTIKEYLNWGNSELIRLQSELLGGRSTNESLSSEDVLDK